MYRSFFSYSLSRQYPYRWFTPLVLIGAVIFTVLFSFLNLGSYGYSISAVLTQSPNQTVLEGFYDRLPSFLASKAKASCQSAILPAFSSVRSNSSTLTYELSQITNGNGELLPALAYHNNVLQNCSINGIDFNFERAYPRTEFQIGWRDWGLKLQSRISCTVLVETSGPTLLNLTTSWDPVPATISSDDLQLFIGRNKMSKASLYWGESLLMIGWMKTTAGMTDLSARNSGSTTQKAAVAFRHRNTTAGITDEYYYDTSYRGSRFHILGEWAGSVETYSFVQGDPQSAGDGLMAPMPKYKAASNGTRFWDVADQLAKSFESTILTDLGQASSSTNILANPDLLQTFTTNFTQDWKENVLWGQTMQYLAHDDYRTSKDSTGPLQVFPATFATTYICNVPVHKPIGELIVAVLVADLVLLQALWKLLILAMGYLLRRQDDRADWCEGCQPHQSTVTYRSISGKTKSHEYTQVSGHRAEELNGHGVDG